MTRSARAAAFVVSLLLAVMASQPRATSPDIVISQVYGGGGNTSAVFRNDFVELFNRGAAPASLTGWSIQYASATGTGNFSANPVTALSGTLSPGQHYLVQLASGGAVGAALPAADATGTVNMSGTGGKVALVNIPTGLACNGGSTVCSAAQLAQIVDLVGWDGANFFEGAGAAPATVNSTAVIRADGGCTDTDNNAADFAAGLPNPRNTGSALAPCLTDVPPSVSSTTPANGAAGVALAANLSVTFSEPVSVTASAFTISCALSGAHAVAISGGPAAFTVDPAANFVSSESCTLTIHASQVTDLDGAPTAMAADVAVTFTTIEACGDVSTAIHTIQGSGPVSLLTGSSRAIEGIVIASYQGAGQLGGYYVQEEDAEADGDPATSEGIFVFDVATPVNAGDKVRVRGTVSEFLSSGTFLTELSPVTGTLVCSSGHALPAVTPVTLPVTSVDAWERYEGMLVTIPQTLTVSDTFTLARFGELVLSANGRLRQPTNVVAPGALSTALQDLNNRSQIVLDDANNQQDIDPTRYPAGGLSAANTVRSGDSIDGVTGVLEQRFGVYRIQPVGAIAIKATNPRPPAPAFVGGTLTVASFNVLNYFNGDGRGGGFPTSRGASTPAEFARQRAKIIAALSSVGPDVAGLMEIENDAPGNSAIEDLVSGLNAALGPDTYAFIDTGIVGTDEIRVALIYKPASVTPLGQFAILDSSVNPDFIDTLNRPSLAQTFTQNSNGKRLTVVVNHLKSKGSDCNDVGDPDTGDGQGNCAVTRTKAAAALAQWIATDPTHAGDPDVLVIGDMNSYAKETPITTLTSAGFVDTIQAHVGVDAYSYVFDGQSGYIDHALASAALAPRVMSVAEWHINADEPIGLDYNVEFKTPNQVNTYYAPDPFRASDHDPLAVRINLIEPYRWSGFFSPIGAVNTVNSGRAVPLKFSLGGDRGLDVFADGFPSSASVACGGKGVNGPLEPTSAAGGSELTYDPSSDQYSYVWKTDQAWAGTCRRLVVTLADGTTHTALFVFSK